jgi:polar amino acid transport system substrate-binding protein
LRTARFIALLTSCLLLQPLCAAPTLRYSAVSSWNMPYGRFEGEQLVDGIMYDLAKAVEKLVRMPVRFVVLPRKRVDAAGLQGDIDLRCYVTPQWSELPDQYVWSGRLFEVTDVLFGAEGTPEPRELGDIPTGAIVSTVLGYGYPTLEPHFSSGHLLREDAVDQEKVNLKMSASRTPYAVSETMALNWYQRITPKHRHSGWRLVIARSDFQCAIPKKGNVDAARILKALETMKKSNQFEEILRKYR